MKLDSRGPVLLVEKSGMMMSVIVSLLHELGFDNITRVTDARTALEKLETVHFKLIICDWYDNAGDMLKLIAHIRNSPDTESTPVVMVSGIIDHSDVEHAISLGVTEYIVKPFTLELFEEKILKAIHCTVKKPVRTRTYSNEDTSEFASKVVINVENDRWMQLTKSILSSFETETFATIEASIKAVKQDNQFDVVVIDEAVASHQRDAMPGLLRLVQLGQIELILLSNNTQPSHFDSVKKIGIKHVVNPDVYLEDLVTRIEMISKLKQAMLHTNRTVRKTELKRKQDGELHNLLTGSVKQRAANISSLSDQLDTKIRGSHFTSNIAQEIKSDAISIDSLADALSAVDSSNTHKTIASKELLRLDTTVSNARLVFSHELSERDISINFDSENNHQFWANPVLFNSLFMFICKSLIKEALYGDIINIFIADIPETDEVLITLSAKLSDYPKLTYLAERTKPLSEGKIGIIYKEAIKHLLDSEVKELSADFNENQKVINLHLTLPAKAII